MQPCPNHNAAIQPLVSVILPTYNEAQNIAELIRRISLAIKDPFEMIVVDDDSTDGTWKCVENLSCNYKGLRLIRRTGRRGLTSAIQEGIDAARSGLIGWMDCDLSMPPEILTSLIAAVKSDADIAIGSRYVPGGKDMRRERLAVFLSRVISYICIGALSNKVRDYTSGFVVAKRSVLERIRLRGDYGEYFIDLMYRALKNGFSVKEIPYILTSRSRGTSKTATNIFGFIRRGRKYISIVLGLFFSKGL